MVNTKVTQFLVKTKQTKTKPRKQPPNSWMESIYVSPWISNSAIISSPEILKKLGRQCRELR